MKKDRFHLDGYLDGFVQISVNNDGKKHLVRATPRRNLGIVNQLLKIDDKKTRAAMMPVEGKLISFTISQTEARQLATEIAGLMKWKSGA